MCFTLPCIYVGCKVLVHKIPHFLSKRLAQRLLEGPGRYAGLWFGTGFAKRAFGTKFARAAPPKMLANYADYAASGLDWPAHSYVRMLRAAALYACSVLYITLT